MRYRRVMVQTFLVDSDFAISASKLDRARLGKQRLEARQILGMIEFLRELGDHFEIPIPTNPYERREWIRQIMKLYNLFDIPPEHRPIKLGFIYHPAVLMWLGYDEALKEYINAHIIEWISRGYKNTLEIYALTTTSNERRPDWTNDPKLHENHKAALYRKEITRGEKKHYIKWQDFEKAYDKYKHKSNKTTRHFDHYIWPYNIKQYS